MNKVQTHPTHSTPPNSLTLLLLFVLALLPRLPGLSRFITTDEKFNVFVAGSTVLAAFLRGDFAGTYWHFYPGVTMSWLESLGLAGGYLWSVLVGATVPPFSQFIFGDELSLLVAARLPFALLTAAMVPLFFLLARRLFSNRAALFGALLLAFDPFFLAHSRVAHGDAPTTVFMSLSALALFVAISAPPSSTFRLRPFTFRLHPSSFYTLLSALFGGLAALTKAPGQFMALFVVGLAVLLAALDVRAGVPWRRALGRWGRLVLLWGVASLVVFVLLWPAMWVDPVGTLSRMLQETFGKVEAGHLVYFRGQPTLDPGLWFYLVVIPFRMTPVALVGAALSLLWFAPPLRRHFSAAVRALPETRLSPVALLWLFTVTLLFFGDLSPKKQDRYLLPLFPLLDLLAAVGWLGVIVLIFSALSGAKFAGRQFFRRLPFAFVLLLVILHALPVVTYYPYYLTYFNPLLGGPRRAAETTLIGWGEGMEQVAAYLNAKPNAEDLVVAAVPSQTLLPFFKGTGGNFYTNDIAFRADVVVLYLSQIQRLAPSPEIVRYFLAQTPEKIITIHGLEYARIYPNTPLILPDTPPQATPVNVGLDDKIRLAGYSLNPDTAEITLYWHALVPLAQNYTVSVRALAGDGTWLAQHDSWPVNGLLPTGQWRQGDVVADTHRLELSADGWGRVRQFQVVVYNADTGQTLGPPVTITNGE